MVSLSYRTFANYIVEDNLVGLRVFLENRHVVVDDRDEVSVAVLLYDGMMDRLTFSRYLLYGSVFRFIYRTELLPWCWHRSKAKVPSSGSYSPMELTQMQKIPYFISFDGIDA